MSNDSTDGTLLYPSASSTTFAVQKTFPSRIQVGGVSVMLHADGSATGATAAEWSEVLANMEGPCVGGVQAILWTILRELQRIEEANAPVDHSVPMR